MKLQPRLFWICVLGAGIPLVFALYTDHAWEDFYITYRTSKNLALGHGLVYAAGERLHTFTSPLGTLLPALASLLTANSSDAVALWIFRGMSIGAFAGTAVLLFAAVRRLDAPPVAVACLLGWLVTDAKCVDFSINGMETGFLLMFFAYSFWALFAAPSRRWQHLGLAWGGLMWTRPDSFIYIASLAGGAWLFDRTAHTRAGSADRAKTWLRAAAVCTAIYLPWFGFAWAYYGSPVPHTVLAKAAITGPRTVGGFCEFLLAFPRWAGSAGSPIGLTFLPAYCEFGGWPDALRLPARIVAAICALLWVVPRFPPATRACSFGFLGSLIYLGYFPPDIYPWYLCLPALLAYLSLGGLLAQVLRAPGAVRWPRVAAALRIGAIGLAATGLAVNAWLLIESGRQLRLQQAAIEKGIRREIGLWLREHAGPGDTVYLEPLGYIGYFSQLKMYDYPGLASREVVAAIRRHGPYAGAVVADLRPTWLVLRPFEAEDLAKSNPGLLAGGYRAVREFSAKAEIEQATVYGMPYLWIDSAFVIYRRENPGGS